MLKTHSTELTPRLYRLAWSWCRDADTAQELVQETWAKALERAGQLREGSKLLPWLSRIMVNIYRDRLRRQREHLELERLELSAGDATLKSLGRDDEIERVREAVARLSEDQRMVLTLVDLMELSYAQVADTLEIPVGTVMSRLSRARRNLRELLEAQEEGERPQLRRVK